RRWAQQDILTRVGVNFANIPLTFLESKAICARPYPLHRGHCTSRSVTRTVAGNNQPMCCETSAAVVLWSEPCLTLGRVGCVEAGDARLRVALPFPFTSLPIVVVENFVFSRVVAYSHGSRADS